LLRPVGDVEGMAREALKVLADDALHRRLAQAGRQRVLGHFDAPLIIPHYEALYRELLGE
ncbi:MAG: N-acetyl-alpha-D-glucosaminyl L-malate synthase BshA, partial [Candidatus Rokuibacteriota bacterium]